MESAMKTFDKTWNKVHSQRSWGKYPAEELIRFMARNFAIDNRNKIKVLDLGCGTGANTWFLAREGFQTYAFDGAHSALKNAEKTCRDQSSSICIFQADAGNIPIADTSFDAVVDVGAISANSTAGIKIILGEIYRVMKPGARFFSSVLFTQSTSGFGKGEKIDAFTFKNIPQGQVAGLGTIHFFTRPHIRSLWRQSGFVDLSIDRLSRTEFNGSLSVSYYIVTALKPAENK